MLVSALRKRAACRTDWKTKKVIRVRWVKAGANRQKAVESYDCVLVLCFAVMECIRQPGQASR